MQVIRRHSAAVPLQADPPGFGAAPLADIIIETQGFESPWPAGLWTSESEPGHSNCRWGRTTYSPDVGSYSISPVVDVCGGSPSGPYPADVRSWAVYGPFDLSDATSAEIRFRSAVLLANGDAVYVAYSGDGTLFSLFPFPDADNSDNWTSQTFDISASAGDDSVWIAFIMSSDDQNDGGIGVRIDEVVIEKNTDATTADLALTLIDATNGSYAPGDSIAVHNITENLGAEASPPYRIDFYASSNTTITESDAHMGGVDLPSLGVGGADDYVDNLQLPQGLGDGFWYIGGILTVADANPDNNVGYDPTAITVSSASDIRIRPLSLDFEEGAMMGAALSIAADAEPYLLPEPSGGNIPGLRARAVDQGRVPLIVGLKVAFTPEGRLAATEVQNQRQAIENAGRNLEADLRGTGARMHRRFRSIPFVALSADVAALDRLVASPRVRSIGEDRSSRPTLFSSNQVIGSPLAWAEGFDGSGQAVAVLDTGVDYTHSWFSTGGGKLVFEACYGTNQTDEIESFCPGMATSSTVAGSGLNCDPGVDGCDHGTHVAGIAVGNDGSGPNFGVARGADLLAIQVFSKFLTEALCGVGQAPCVRTRTSDQIAALEEVLIQSAGLDIAAVNMSLGGGEYTSQASCDEDPGNLGVKAAIDNLRSAGIATVIASGNDGWFDAIGAPGCISSAVSVGATTDNDQVAGFSNVYPEIHLLAPGVSIDSAVPGDMLGSKQGTSMATPHVAGAWAVLRQRYPAATVAEILGFLQGTGTLVDDERAGGVETNMPRINLDLALGEPRSTFGIFNDGPGTLEVTGIVPETAAPWIGVDPAAPFSVNARELQVVEVTVDYDLAPEGTTQTRLQVSSDDPDESPYPGGVFVNVTTAAAPAPEFDSSPAPGSSLDFPDTVVNGPGSSPLQVTVQNLGDADLTLASCTITGANSSQFTLTQCPTGAIAPAGMVIVAVTCNPTSVGAKVASLDLLNDDADESNVSYDLTCTGIDTPPENLIYADGFETMPP